MAETMTKAPKCMIANLQLKTDLPILPRSPQNLLLGSFQIVFWLFFHPSAWRNYVARIDPTLQPQFALADLNRSQLSHPAIRRMLFSGCVFWPVLSGIVMGFIAWGLGLSDLKAAMSITFAVTTSLSIGLVAGFSISLAGSLGCNVVMGLAAGACIGTN